MNILDRFFVGVKKSPQGGLDTKLDRESWADSPTKIEPYEETDTHPFSAVDKGNSLVLQASHWMRHDRWMRERQVERAKDEKEHAEKREWIISDFLAFHARFHAAGEPAACPSDF